MKNNENLAKITIDKSVLKEYSFENFERVVYIDDESTFQIQLFNSYTYPIGVSVKLNGYDSSNKLLVLKPGERVWLDRYLDKKVKFKFSTYKVDDTSEAREAIKMNGEVEIRFYKGLVLVPRTISVATLPFTYVNSTPASNFSDGNEYLKQQLSTLNDFVYTTNTSISTTNCSYSLNTGSIETGRIEEGGYSSQEFQNCNYSFEQFPFKAEIIHILPSSRKPITKSDLSKRYCPECGRKVKEKFKFCPFCGTKQ